MKIVLKRRRFLALISKYAESSEEPLEVLKKLLRTSKGRRSESTSKDKKFAPVGEFGVYT